MSQSESKENLKRYTGFDCFLPFPGQASFRCRCGKTHNVYVTRGTLSFDQSKNDLDVTLDVTFDFYAKPCFATQWIFIPLDDCDLEATRVKAKNLAKKMRTTGGKLQAMIYGPFACRENTYTLRSWQENDNSEFDDEQVAQAELVMLLLRKQALEKKKAEALAQRQEAENRGNENAYRAQLPVINSLNEQLDALGAKIDQFNSEQKDHGDQGSQGGQTQ